MKSFKVLLAIAIFTTSCLGNDGINQLSLPPLPELSALEKQEVAAQSTATSSSGAVHKYQLARINDTRIQAYEKQIEALFRKNGWMRWGGYALGAAAAVGAAGYLYSKGTGTSVWNALPVLSWFSSNKGAQPAVPAVAGGVTHEEFDKFRVKQEATNEYSVQQLGKIDNIIPAKPEGAPTTWLESAKNAVGRVASGVNRMTFGIPGDFANKVIYGSFTGVGSSLLMAGIARGASPLQNLYDGVYHEGDIKWYLTKHTTTKSTIQELLSIAHDLALASQEYERETALESFIHLYQKFIMCYEQIVAFIQYKHKQNLTNVYAASGMQMSAKHMRQDADQFTHYIEDVINDGSRHIALPELVHRFELQLNKRINTYRQFENFLNEVAV